MTAAADTPHALPDTPTRPVRAAWAAGRAARNVWLSLPDPHLVELVAARSGADALTLDLQHGLYDRSSTLSAIRAAAGYPISILARLPGPDPALTGFLLDAGIAGVILPVVESPADGEALVAACRYPPRGQRSHGPFRNGLGHKADAFLQAADALVFAMVETRAALDCCAELAAIDGMDGLFVGPGDLGLALGLGVGQHRREPEMLAAYDRVIAACRQAGGHAGIYNSQTGYAREMAGRGFDLVTYWADTSALVASLTTAAEGWSGNARG